MALSPRQPPHSDDNDDPDKPVSLRKPQAHRPPSSQPPPRPSAGTSRPTRRTNLKARRQDRSSTLGKAAGDAVEDTVYDAADGYLSRTSAKPGPRNGSSLDFDVPGLGGSGSDGGSGSGGSGGGGCFSEMLEGCLPVLVLAVMLGYGGVRLLIEAVSLLTS